VEQPSNTGRRTFIDDSADGLPPRTTSVLPEVRLTAAVRPIKDGGLEVLVSWDWAVVGNSAKKSAESQLFEFTVHWARKTCNVDKRLPHCDDPDAYYSNSAWSHGPKVRVDQTRDNRHVMVADRALQRVSVNVRRKIHACTSSNAHSLTLRCSIVRGRPNMARWSLW